MTGGLGHEPYVCRPCGFRYTTATPDPRCPRCRRVLVLKPKSGGIDVAAPLPIVQPGGA